MHFATPISSDRSHNVQVGMYSAIVRSDRDEKHLAKCQEATGFGAVLGELRNQLRGSVSAKEVDNLREQVQTVSQVVQARPVVEVDQTIRDRATELLKKPVKSKKLRVAIRKLVVERSAQQKDKLKEALKEVGHPAHDWVNRVVDGVLQALGSVKAVFKDCGSKTYQVWSKACSDVRKHIKEAAKGKLFDNENTMSKSAFTHCHQAFQTLGMWDTIFKGPIEDTLKCIRDENMKAFYIEVLKLDLNSDTAEAILETLEASFNCPTKMNEVRSAFFKETKHFSETSWKFFRDTPSDSVPQTVLNALFENLFGDLAAGEDVFRHGRDNAEAKAELEAIFSEANLDEQKEVLREVLETEIAKLMTDKIFPALMRLFESGKKGTKKIMNIVKQAYRDVEGSTKVGDQQGAAKAEKFRQLCQRTATTCDKLAELEASPGLQETMLMKCIRAKSKLDRFMADPDTKLTSTEDMQLLKRYGEKLPRQGYPVEDQEHWLTWEAVSDAVGSLELTLNSGEPQPPPPQAVLEKGLPLGLFNHLQNQRVILVPANPPFC